MKYPLLMLWLLLAGAAPQAPLSQPQPQAVPEPAPGAIGLHHATRYPSPDGALLFAADEPAITIEASAAAAPSVLRQTLPALLRDHAGLTDLTVTLADTQGLIDDAATALAQDRRWDRRHGRAANGPTSRLIAVVITAGPLKPIAAAFAARGWSLTVETAARITLIRRDGALLPGGIASLVFHAASLTPRTPSEREETPR